MTEQALFQQFQQLPDELKREILDFVEFIINKYHIQQKKENLPRFGSAKGHYEMAEDFDAPLDIFNEYTA